MAAAAALFLAIDDENVADVERFFNNNPGSQVVDTLDQYGLTPLTRAIQGNNEAIVEVLLSHGASVSGLKGAFRTPLQQACNNSNSRTKGIVSLLINHGADLNTISPRFQHSPLSVACSSDEKLGIAQLLVNAGANVNGDGGIIAPLHEAAYYKAKGAVQLLIQAGADVNILSNKSYAPLSAGSSPLHFAAYGGNLDCTNNLLAAGADPNIANSEGQTPLHRAAYHLSVRVVNALLAAGSDPLHQDNDGRTPLRYMLQDRRNKLHSEFFNILTALVAAGDRSWECVPTPCPGLEAAMLSVWQAAPEELPELVKRLKNPPQNLTELVPRMDDDDEMKKVVQEVLRVLHCHFAGFPQLKEHLFRSIFGLKTV